MILTNSNLTKNRRTPRRIRKEKVLTSNHKNGNGNVLVQEVRLRKQNNICEICSCRLFQSVYTMHRFINIKLFYYAHNTNHVLRPSREICPYYHSTFISLAPISISKTVAKWGSRNAGVLDKNKPSFKFLGNKTILSSSYFHEIP